jgi:hypothetical protein
MKPPHNGGGKGPSRHIEGGGGGKEGHGAASAGENENGNVLNGNVAGGGHGEEVLVGLGLTFNKAGNVSDRCAVVFAFAAAVAD